MKTKIVLWGENAENEKILLAIELLEKDNKILIHVFPQEVATEEFYQTMLDKWRENHEVVFPANHKTIERPLSISDSLLPDDIKTERTDVISRAQAEWHFVVLSTKLYETYKGEIDELKELLELKKKERDLILGSLLKRNITHQGDWSLIPVTRTRREVLLDEVRKKHPDIYRKIAKVSVSVTDLEKALGEDNIKDLISTKAYISYTTVYDPHGLEG